MTNPKDEAASEFEKAYEEFRHKHINASFMPKEMASFMWLAGRASKEIRLPEERVIKNYHSGMDIVEQHTHSYDSGFNDCLHEIKALNECEGEK